MTELGYPKSTAVALSGACGIRSIGANPDVGDVPSGSTEFGWTTRPGALN